MGDEGTILLLRSKPRASYRRGRAEVLPDPVCLLWHRAPHGSSDGNNTVREQGHLGPGTQGQWTWGWC